MQNSEGAPFSLDAYEHILLDMNGTFVFGFDRFGLDEDFGATYERRGHASLAREEAQARVRAAYDYMAVRYIDEAYYHRFPTVAEALRATSDGRVLAQAVVDELVDTFTQHELGYLPDTHREALYRLRENKPLSVLSNLWAPKDQWLDKFAEWGIADLFDHLHFSSDGAEMKPHPAFFERALSYIGLSPKRVLYVGDSYRCDVMGARGVGMDVVWLSGGKEDDPGHATAVAEDLVSLTNSAW